MLDNLQMDVPGLEDFHKWHTTGAPRSIRNGLRAAIGAAATVVVQSARQIVPRDSTYEYTGMMKRALGKRDSKHTQQKIYSVVGARRQVADYAYPVNSRFRGTRLEKLLNTPDSKGGAKLRAKWKERLTSKEGRSGRLLFKKPSKYLHLLSKGHKFGGWALYRGGQGMVRARPFLLAASRLSRGVVEEMIYQRVRGQVAKMQKGLEN